jgi:hypothetical protein
VHTIRGGRGFSIRSELPANREMRSVHKSMQAQNSFGIYSPLVESSTVSLQEFVEPFIEYIESETEDLGIQCPELEFTQSKAVTYLEETAVKAAIGNNPTHMIGKNEAMDLVSQHNQKHDSVQKIGFAYPEIVGSNKRKLAVKFSWQSRNILGSRAEKLQKMFHKAGATALDITGPDHLTILQLPSSYVRKAPLRERLVLEKIMEDGFDLAALGKLMVGELVVSNGYQEAAQLAEEQQLQKVEKRQHARSIRQQQKAQERRQQRQFRAKEAQLAVA